MSQKSSPRTRASYVDSHSLKLPPRKYREFVNDLKQQIQGDQEIIRKLKLEASLHQQVESSLRATLTKERRLRQLAEESEIDALQHRKEVLLQNEMLKAALAASEEVISSLQNVLCENSSAPPVTGPTEASPQVSFDEQQDAPQSQANEWSGPTPVAAPVPPTGPSMGSPPRHARWEAPLPDRVGSSPEARSPMGRPEAPASYAQSGGWDYAATLQAARGAADGPRSQEIDDFRSRLGARTTPLADAEGDAAQSVIIGTESSFENTEVAGGVVSTACDETQPLSVQQSFF
mmetsp:Transcript_123643/g.283496  ORF Transcript_123643/g.283496 Transcript_123643/m.283496 type:complete len:290 (+) Transcript_123643:44-913(+)